jgi:predicted nucleic acid-binding protein
MAGKTALRVALMMLLDSVILIDHMNERPEAALFLRQHFEECVVSPVTRGEVLAGLEGEGANAARHMLDQYACLEIRAADGDLAGFLRRHYRWKMPDALQMAVAKTHGLTLVTRNTKDFDPNKHDNVMVPYHL